MSDVKASEIVTLAKRTLSEKWGYIWGGYGQIHTQKAQDNATREQTKKWGQQWVGKHVIDCSGLFWWAYKQCGGYMCHGCNTMWNKYTTAKGKLKNGQRDDGQALKPGTAVFLTKGDDRHHVGMYIGDGFVIEAKGTYYGVVKSSVKVWDEWAELKTTIYDVDENGAETIKPAQTSTSAATATETSKQESVAEEVNITLTVLESGASGDQVKALQRLLNGCGHNCGSVDGKFGAKTTAAVKSFQKANGLTIDGVCGLNTWKALLGA